ncbi:hemolysin-type calcium-binding repeat 2 copies family protein [Asticcacaulis biprosthecium C19]|uniref:Hemolysin-type calcium-binding repeat 2 copies family protein n=1 Tax=Asticcacaulis biprosthecium C19 TaxID=715226 RepID=F4QGJ6_9CAUL|nr:hemolysin-type calcium-binding repeat 2 copies family protein [Asticcacaulis biprosthecium C19]
MVDGDDVVIEAANGGNDWVLAGRNYNLGAEVENLAFSGTGNFVGNGNAGANILSGNSGNNTLNGGGGNDILAGGLGADIFLFGTASGADTINDFKAAQNDMINVNAYSGGTAHAGWVSQSGAHVVITLGDGNTITVSNASQADVLSHMVW